MIGRQSSGKASLSKTAELAGVSMSEMIDLLAAHGIPSNLGVEEYRERLREVW